MATFPSDSVRTKNWGTEVLTDADLEGQFDLLHNYLQAALNSSTGHTHAGTSNQGPKIDTGGLAADAADATIVDVSDDYTWTGTHDFTGATVSGATTFASAAEVLTGTEAAKAVSPSTLVSHDGAVKGWISFDGTSGSIGTGSNSFNVSGVTDNGTGDYTIAWDTDFADGNYAIAGMAEDGAETGEGTGAYVAIKFGTTPAAGSVRIAVGRCDTGAKADVNTVTLIAIGDR